ncbi:MAG: murein biosynthesis integral membrane protein MurJ [Chloroflexota bacterium]|nr:murein biosynthesis integral membrane protein MurJ [Chloroflexota bacterium]
MTEFDGAGGAAPTEAPSPRPGRSAGQILLDASLILAVTAVASRILGWVRLVVIGSQFGASEKLDAYFAAFLIPDAIFQLVVAGALFTALVPVFVSYRARDQDDEAWQVASSVVNILVLALAALAVVVAIFAPVLVPVVAPGFDAPTTDLTVRLTRIMLLSPIFIGLGAVVTGILNTYDRWAVPAMAPLVYNLSIIFAAIFVAPILGVEALAVGVAVGSLLHLAIQLPSLAAVGHRYDLTLGLRHPGVRRVALLTGPRTLGLAAGQINLIVSTVLASGLAEGSVAAYNYAFQLSQIPAGVVGVSIAVALFPTLSRDAALGRLSEIRRQVAGSLRVIVFIALPITAIMIVLAEPITGVFFQYGLFDARAASRTAGALLFFAIGLAANSAVHLLVRAFYAMHETRTPVLWAILAVVLNVPLMVWLVGPMGIGGLALAFSITATAEAVGLLWALRNRIHSIEGAAIGRSVLRAGLAAGAAALLMLGGLQVVHSAFAGLLESALGRIAVLSVLSIAGLAIYLLVARALHSPELGQLREMVRRRFGRHRG